MQQITTTLATDGESSHSYTNIARTCRVTQPSKARRPHGLTHADLHKPKQLLSSSCRHLNCITRSADLQCEPVFAPGDQAHRLAVHAPLHGLIQGLSHPPPVIEEGAPVHHDLQLPTGQGPTPLSPVCQYCQLCRLIILQREYLILPCYTQSCECLALLTCNIYFALFIQTGRQTSL